jgi:amidase
MPVRRRERRAALSGDTALGPLHGVPGAIKDLFDFNPGGRRFGGIPALRDLTPDTYCAFAERAERARAVLVGKGNRPVMGLCGATDNPELGPSRTRSTRRRTRAPGADGRRRWPTALLTVAEGTDRGGSIRIPASWCGIYGRASSGPAPDLPRADRG